MKHIVFFITLLSLTSCGSFTPVGKSKKIKKNFTAKWIKNLDPSYQTGNLPIALGGPVIHDGVVYVGNNNGSLDAFSLSNGRMLWSEKTLGAMNSSPVIHNDILIYGDAEGRMYAKDLNSLEFKYQFDLGSPIESTPVISNGRLFVHTRNHKLFCVDATTGKILWSYKRSVPYFSTIQRTSRPLVLSNRVFVGFADGFLVSFTIEEGQVVWEKKLSTANKFVDVDMTPSFFRGKLIVSSIDGNAEIIDPQSGLLYKRLDFSTNRKGVFFKDEVFMGTKDGRLVSLNDNYLISKEIKVSKDPISSLGLWKDGLVVSTIGNKVYFLNDKLQVEETFDLGSKFSAVFGEFSVKEDAMALLSSRNRLYLFK